MDPVSLTRITVGAVVLAGLLLYEPVAYFGAGMMIFSGLAGT